MGNDLSYLITFLFLSILLFNVIMLGYLKQGKGTGMGTWFQEFKHENKNNKFMFKIKKQNEEIQK